MVKLSTDLYCQPTDSHQYLHYDSCHAEHIKRSIIFSQALRLKRVCSQKSDLDSQSLVNISAGFFSDLFPILIFLNIY